MTQTTIERAPPTWRRVAAVVTGNGLEFYDFLTFSFFAVQIGQSPTRTIRPLACWPPAPPPTTCSTT